MTDGSAGGALFRVRAILIDDARRVLRRAWSVRLMVAAAALSGLEVAISAVQALQVALPIAPGIFAGLAGLVSVAAFVARFIAQKKEE